MSLPDTVQVLERGWLSANNIVLGTRDEAILVDSGYVGHAEQTLALVDHALAGRRLVRIVNTHCHSDHMGGNARLAAHHRAPVHIPAGEAPLIDAWDDRELILGYAGQRADRFTYQSTFAEGDVLRMGSIDWQVIASPGHDAGSVMFHAPEERLLISADALWQNGFGVVFGALLGAPQSIAEARATLERIATLGVRTVVPGHGAVFTDVEPAIERALGKLEYYAADIERLARHCVKVLFVYTLLDRRAMPEAEVAGHLRRVQVYVDLNRDFIRMGDAAFAEWLVGDLVRAGAIAREDGRLVPRIKA